MIEKLSQYGQRKCLLNESRCYIYEETQNIVLNIARELERRYGSERNVCIFMNHSMETVFCLLACIENGCNIYIIHPSSTEEMIEKAMLDQALFIVDDRTRQRLSYTKAVDQMAFVIYDELMDNQEEITVEEHRTRDYLAHIIIRTSGTTSNAIKLVQQPFNNLYIKSKMIADLLRIAENDRNMLISPLCFVQSLWTLFIHLIKGAAICVVPFKARQFSSMLKDYGITTLMTTPSVIRGTIDNTKNPHQLRLLSIGGDYMEESLIEKLRKYWPEVCYANVFGSTEGAAADTVLEPVPFKTNSQSMRSVGKETWYSRVFILKEDGTIAKENEEGIICIESPMFQSYYYHSDIRMKQEAGYYKTYDIGYKDKEGYLYYCGRNAHIIVCNGEKISAIEVEKVVYELDGVKEVAVTGVRHPIYGQVPKCYIVADSNLTEEQVQAFLTQKLEKYKIPREIEFVTELKKTISDKVIRIDDLFH